MKIKMPRTSDMIYDEIVVGAGASGLFYAAKDSYERLHKASDTESLSDSAQWRRLILEKSSRPGQKLLMSGNGHCNITHAGSIKDFIDKYGDSGKKIRTILYKHNNTELMGWLTDLGLPLTEREDGKVYPESMKAKDVLDTLINAASENGWDIRCGMGVLSVRTDEPGLIRLTTENGREFCTRKLIIGTGGASYPSTGSDGSFADVLSRDLGLEIAELKPALAPIYVQDFAYGELAGVSFDDVIVSSGAHSSRGPMLITHKGLSGPAILHLSQYVRAGDRISINFLPDMSMDDVLNDLVIVQPGNKSGIANVISARYSIPKAFVSTVIRDPERHFNSVDQKELRRVASTLTGSEYFVSGTGGWNDAMVTKGGVMLDQIVLKTMRVKGLAPDIRIIGEALDVNGDTGGYNLQFAYSSAMTARF